METPVIYFYSKEPQTVDVRVDFPQGIITEWYPQATTFGRHMLSRVSVSGDSDSQGSFSGAMPRNFYRL